MKFENKKNLKVKVKVQPTTQLVQCQRERAVVGRAGPSCGGARKTWQGREVEWSPWSQAGMLVIPFNITGGGAGAGGVS